MAKSSFPEFRPWRPPQGIHLLLSVGMPTAFGWLVWFYLAGQGPGWPLGPLGTAYTLVLALWAGWRHQTHQGLALKLWWWAVPTLALYGALALADGQPWPRTLAFDGPHFFWFVAALYQGNLGAVWASQLAGRARLFQLIDGLDGGPDLELRVRDFHEDADFSVANYRSLAGVLGVMGTVPVFAAFQSPFGRGGLTEGLLAAYLTGCLLAGVLLRVYRREMVALMYGHRLSWSEKVVPLGWSLGLAVAAGTGAWALTALVGPLVDWSALGGISKPVPPVPQTGPPSPPGSLAFSDVSLLFYQVLAAILLAVFHFDHIVSFVRLAFTVGAWAVPAAVLAFLAWPLVRWVADGGRETRGLGRKWWALVVDQVRGFLRAWREWWQGPKGLPGSSRRDPGAGTQEWIRTFLGRPAAGRQRPYPEVVEAFLDLVRWAEPLTAYRRGETTHSYLDRVAELVPVRAATLAELRDLLDQDLFGPRNLGSDGRQRFLDLVRHLTAEPASHDPPPGVS